MGGHLQLLFSASSLAFLFVQPPASPFTFSLPPLTLIFNFSPPTVVFTLLPPGSASCLPLFQYVSKENKTLLFSNCQINLMFSHLLKHCASLNFSGLHLLRHRTILQQSLKGEIQFYTNYHKIKNHKIKRAPSTASRKPQRGLMKFPETLPSPQPTATAKIFS